MSDHRFVKMNIVFEQKNEGALPFTLRAISGGGSQLPNDGVR